MEMINVVNEIYQKGKRFLNAKQLDIVINEIKKSIYQTYFDRSSAHFASCQASLESAKLSNNPELEIRAAIHHLYDAFFSLYDLCDKKIKRKSIIGIEYNDYVVKYQEDIYVPCCKISILIYGLYCFLGEDDNANVWSDYMLDTFNKAKDLLSYGDEKHEIYYELYNNLKRIDSKFVKRRLGYEWAGRYHPSNSLVIRYFITVDGCNYGKKIIKDLENRIQGSLDNNYIFEEIRKSNIN